MIVTLMLAWFDEPEEMLYDCVTSAAVIADRIVAADGAYQMVPDKAPTSPPSQRRAIERAAKDTGLDIDFMPARLWEGQVQKRNALLRAATERLGDRDHREFVMPLDADWILKGDRDQIRAELEHGYIEQYFVRFHQPTNPKANLHTTAPHQWHVQYDGKTLWEPLLFRALYNMKLEKTHWHYSGERKGGLRVGLSGGARLYPQGVTKRLRSDFVIEHRCMFRDRKQLERNRAYCEVRDRERELVGYEV